MAHPRLTSRKADVKFSRIELRDFLNRELPFYQIHWNGIHPDAYYNVITIGVNGEVREMFLYGMIGDESEPIMVVLYSPQVNFTEYIVLEVDEDVECEAGEDRVLQPRQTVYRGDGAHDYKTLAVLAQLLAS